MAKVQNNESLIKRKVQLLDGTSGKIESVTTRGYKVTGRSKQLMAGSMVKVGASLTEIEKPRASQIEDSGKGFANIIDAELFEEVHGKPMKSSKSKTSKPKSSKSKTSKPKSSKSKTSKPKSSKSKTSKPKSSKTKAKVFIDSFADKPILEPLISKVSKVVRDHFDSLYDYDGDLRINTEVFAPEIVDDPNSPVVAINCTVVQDLPEQDVELDVPLTMSIKAKKIVTTGLWEKSTKAQDRAAKAFGEPLVLGTLLESDRGTEFMFVGARKTEEGARLVFDATGDKVVVKQLTITRAAELLQQVKPDEGFDEEDSHEDDFDFDDMVDGDDLDEEENSEMASTLDEEVFSQFNGDSEAIAEFLLENYSTDVMITYIEENYEETSDISKIISKGDALRLAELIGATEGDGVDEDDMELAEDLSDIDDLDGDLEDDLIDEDGDETGLDEEIDSELDFDAMADALSDGDFVDAKQLRKMDDAAILAAYDQHFGTDDEELPHVDLMIDALLEEGLIKPRDVRKLTDAEITKMYKDHISSIDADEELAEDLDAIDDLDDDLDGDEDLDDLDDDLDGDEDLDDLDDDTDFDEED